MSAYPAVFLESLSAAGATFASSLWSVLRIEVKESLSKGKLGKKKEMKNKDEKQT